MEDKLFKVPLASRLKGADGDVALASKVQLARNFSRLPFPNRAGLYELEQVFKKASGAVNELEERFSAKFSALDLERLNSLERRALIAKNLLSSKNTAHVESRSLLISEDESISIMVNGEDHLEIQCMADGLELDRLLARAFAADDIFEAREDIAYDESLGYLTASPANVGTGLRAGVMLHLPGLFAAKQIDKLAENAASVGIVLQGLFNEKGEAGSNLFRIYNQFTIGFSEAEIINNLKATAGKLIAQERKARRALYKDSADDVEDRVWRSFGILQYARIITRAEALRLLSDVRLGIDLSLIKNVRAEVFNELLIATRNGFLQHCQGSSNLSPQENDKLRAAIIRKALTGDGA